MRFDRIERVLGSTVNETWKYDDLGRILWHKDFKEQTTWYRYDETTIHGGRLIGEYRYKANVTPSLTDNPETFATAYDEKTLYVYDNDASVPTAQRKMLGRQSRIEEWGARGSAASIRTKKYEEYDAITGGVKQISMLEGATVSSTIHHVYDSVNGRLIRTYTASNDTGYGYDLQGRLDRVHTFKLNGGTSLGSYTGFDPATRQPTYSGSPLVATYTYDAVGNQDTVTQNNGTTTTADDLKHDYDYDALKRLDTLTVTRGGVKVFRQDYDYESADHRYEYEADGQRRGVAWLKPSITRPAVGARYGDAASF